MSRLIDADAFDRRLANAEFMAALNHADDNDKPFEHEAMYYSTQSFRDVMSHQPTVDAIPVEWLMDMANRGDFVYSAVTRWKYEQELSRRRAHKRDDRTDADP